MAVAPVKKPAYKRSMAKKMKAPARATKAHYVPLDVRTIREKLGMRREQMAMELGVAFDTIRDWEKTQRVPRWGLIGIQRLADDSAKEAS